MKNNRIKNVNTIEEKNKTTIIHYDKAWTTGDVSFLETCLPPHFVAHGHRGTQKINRESYILSVSKFSQDFAVLKFERNVLMAKDNKICSAYSGHLVQRKTGAHIRNFRAINIYKLQRDKIIELWFGRDDLAFYQGLGLVVNDEKIKQRQEELNR